MVRLCKQQTPAAADLSAWDSASPRKRGLRMNSPDAGGVTSAGAMRPFVRILWPLVDDVQVDVVAGADAVQRGNLRLRRVSSLHTATLPGRLGRARNILLVCAMQPPAVGSLPSTPTSDSGVIKRDQTFETDIPEPTPNSRYLRSRPTPNS